MSEPARNWLLLRGLSREQRHWGELPERLRQTLGSKVVCLDLPGVGTEVSRPSPSKIEGISDDLRLRFSDLRATEGGFGIFAVSLGGMIALDWVHRYPSDFEIAVIVNSSAGNLSRPQDRLRLQNLGPLMAMMREPDPMRRESRLLKLITNHRGDEQDLARAFGEVSRSAPVSFSVMRAQVVAAMRFQTPERVETPLEFFVSAHDRFVDPSCTYRLAERYRSPVRVHPSAGHELPLDDPDWVVEEIRKLS